MVTANEELREDEQLSGDEEQQEENTGQRFSRADVPALGDQSSASMDSTTDSSRGSSSSGLTPACRAFFKNGNPCSSSARSVSSF